MTGPRQNVELKYRCPDPDLVRRNLAGLDLHEQWTEQQVDTYFVCAAGRLKLRQREGRGAELIWYERPDQAVSRSCLYRVVPVSDAGGLKAALTAALGVRGEVVKRRQVSLWQNVRIHLDEVAELGWFVEFEAVLTHPDEAVAGHRDLAWLADTLGLRTEDRLAVSYADLAGL